GQVARLTEPDAQRRRVCALPDEPPVLRPFEPHPRLEQLAPPWRDPRAAVRPAPACEAGVQVLDALVRAPQHHPRRRLELDGSGPRLGLVPRPQDDDLGDPLRAPLSCNMRGGSSSVPASTQLDPPPLLPPASALLAYDPETGDQGGAHARSTEEDRGERRGGHGDASRGGRVQAARAGLWRGGGRDGYERPGGAQ